MSISGALTTSRMDKRHKLRSEYTSKLEVESQRMEDRLKMLKTMLAAEKAKRNVEGAIHWKSTKPSPPIKPGRAGMGQSPNKPVRVRVLTDKTRKSKVATLSSTQCGQCDKGSASLCCIECVENYCQVCFVKIHQKGALANHHVKPFLSKVSAKLGEEATAKSKEPCTSKEIKQTSSSAVGTHETGNSLLDGAYDEGSSAASFQEALTEWRTGGSKKPTTSRGENTYQTKDSMANTTTSSSTNTNTSSESAISKKKKEVEISFSHDAGVSYLEKLITRRNRYDPTLFKKMVPKQATHVPVAIEDTEDSNEVMDYVPTPYNIFYKPDDVQDTFDEDYEELYRPMSSVQIEEIAEPPVVSTTTVKEVPRASEASKIAKPKKRAISSGKSSTQMTIVKKNTGTKKNTKKTRPSSTTMKHHRSVTPSWASELDVQSSVQRSWADCLKENHHRPQTAELSQFFLQGVEPLATADISDNGPFDSGAHADTDLKFAATIWLPFNSVSTDSEPHNIEQDSDGETDEPSLTGGASRCNSALSSKSQQDVESGELLAERDEWDKQDNDALDSLTWELASTIESEGQLSRCNSEMDSIEDQYENEEEPVGYDDVQVEPVDMSQVVSQFELYQQQLLDEEL